MRAVASVVDWFYNTTAWKKCREAYRESVGGLCERCAKQGLVVPGEQVHHKVRLTPSNVNDPSVALNWDNLELLCQPCHYDEHRRKRENQRYVVDDDGNVIIKGDGAP